MCSRLSLTYHCKTHFNWSSDSKNWKNGASLYLVTVLWTHKLQCPGTSKSYSQKELPILHSSFLVQVFRCFSKFSKSFQNLIFQWWVLSSMYLWGHTLEEVKITHVFGWVTRQCHLAIVEDHPTVVFAYMCNIVTTLCWCSHVTHECQKLVLCSKIIAHIWCQFLMHFLQQHIVFSIKLR